MNLRVQVMLVLVVEHVLLLLRILVVGAADKVPKSIRDAQDEAAVEEKKGREDFRRRAAGHAVRFIVLKYVQTIKPRIFTP